MVPSLRMTDAEIDAFLAGPPYLPFCSQFFIIAACIRAGRRHSREE
jgi:hypothetical protein